MKPKDVVTAIAASALFVMAVSAAWYFIDGPAAFAAASVVFFSGIALLALSAYRRFFATLARDRRRLGSLMVHESGNCYRQIEALINVRSELSIQKALPAMRGWSISPDFAEVMISELSKRSPEHVLECGSGVSTLVVGYFLKMQGVGRLVSLEHDREHAERTSRLVEQHGLQARVKVMHAPLVEHDFEEEKYTWYDVSAIRDSGFFDFVVVDGPPQDSSRLARWPLLRVLGSRLAAGTAIIMDDAKRRDEQEILRRWQETVPDVVISGYATEKGAAVVQLPL